MQVTARVDYAVRSVVELAASDAQRMSRDELAAAQDIPPRYLESILAALRQADLLIGTRGASGGYALARAPEAITVADIARAVDGPLALVQGRRPEQVAYTGATGRSTSCGWGFEPRSAM
ncbi:MAG: Rrf2 family transcriptional regulator [Acidimicrobiales bacterium]